MTRLVGMLTSLIIASLFFDFVMSFGTAGSGMTTSSVLLVTSGTAILTEIRKYSLIEIDHTIANNIFSTYSNH